MEGEFMHNHSSQEITTPNPALKPFSVLIGNWNTTGTHGQLPDTVLHGQASFEWLEYGAFLLIRSSVDDPRFPRTITLIASDDAQAEYYMLTFDDRGVSRKYEVSLQNNVWKWWRNAPGFLQRYEVRIAEDGNTLIGSGELSKDGVSWEKDLNLTYTRVP
jgi:hypothetical protein